MSYGLLKGKKGIIFGALMNNRSLGKLQKDVMKKVLNLSYQTPLLL